MVLVVLVFVGVDGDFCVIEKCGSMVQGVWWYVE